MQKKIKISVVIPCYNAEKYIEETLQSVLEQTYSPFEIIVINDGSTDGTRKILERYKKFIRIIDQDNRGDCSARNRGLKEARSEWIAFIDADDLWHPDKLLFQVDVLTSQSSDIVCIHTDFYLLFPNNDIQKEKKSFSDLFPGLYKPSFKKLMLEPYVNTSTAMVRKLKCVFPEGYTQGGDMIYFAQLSFWGFFYYIDKPLVFYRQHSHQITKDSNAWVVHFKNRFRWLAENRDLIGNDLYRDVNNELKKQVLYWLKLAKWNRQWSRYFSLKQYALTLDWGEKLPLELSEHILPFWVYSIKDKIDLLIRRILK